MSATSSPLTPPATTEPIEWLRPKDVPRRFGIGRSRLYELMNEQLIRSCVLRQKGNVHGMRLIHAGSVNAYLESLARGGTPKNEPCAGKDPL